MILIMGIPTESPVKLLLEAAKKIKIPYLMLNQREIRFWDLSIKYVNNKFSGQISLGDQKYDLESFSGIYVRMMDYNHLPEVKDEVFKMVNPREILKISLIHTKLLEWLAITKCRILNKPTDMLSNLSKPYQAQIIAECGLKVPSHCITSNKSSAVSFAQKCGPLIYKSISSARSIVKELDLNDSKKLNKIKYLPTQFQQKLEGYNIRVHVVGNKLFATKAVSNVVDYRYASQDGEEIELLEAQLPKHIEESCFKLSAKLNLALCGIDLFLTTQNEYYCFEVNPSPGYSFYQELTGQDIAAAIANWLAYGDAR